VPHALVIVFSSCTRLVAGTGRGPIRSMQHDDRLTALRRDILTIDTRRAERPLFRKQGRRRWRIAAWVAVLVLLAVGSGLMVAGDLGVVPL